MFAPDPQDKKFDFQNIDTKLYLALRKLSQEYKTIADSGDGGNWYAEEQASYQAAQLAMEEFELSHGPIPDWAVARNWDYSLVPGAQLCTRDGRRMGNAHIVKTDIIAAGPVAVPVFVCLTDAGSKFTHTEPELLGAFTIGDWISDPQRVIKDFDRNGEFVEEPNGQP